MSVDVLLNFLNKLRKRYKMQGLPKIFLFRSKFNNTQAQLLNFFIT